MKHCRVEELSARRYNPSWNFELMCAFGEKWKEDFCKHLQRLNGLKRNDIGVNKVGLEFSLRIAGIEERGGIGP